MCQTADYLRWQLYQASRHYEPSVYAPVVPDAETLAAIHSDQATGEHVGALQALLQHNLEHGCQHVKDDSWRDLS